MKDCRHCKLFELYDLMIGEGWCEYHQLPVNIYDKACEDIMEVAPDIRVGSKAEIVENKSNIQSEK